MARYATATPNQRLEARRLWIEIYAELTNPQGSSLDPQMVLEALQSIQSLIRSSDNHESAKYLDKAAAEVGPLENPDDFLYLTLPREVLDQPVNTLKLTERPLNCLHRENISTVDDLLQRSGPELLEIRNFGAVSLREVTTRLDERGWHLSTHGQGLAPPPGDQWVKYQDWLFLRSRFIRLPVDKILRWNSQIIASLKELGIVTVGQLVSLTDVEVLRLPWDEKPATYVWKFEKITGFDALEIINASLQDCGLSLTQETDR